MSVLGITAIHGVAVLFVGLKTGSRAWLVLAALASAAVGVVTGSPMYLGMDLLGVCLGLAAGWVCIRPKKPAAPGHQQHRALDRSQRALEVATVRRFLGDAEVLPGAECASRSGLTAPRRRP